MKSLIIHSIPPARKFRFITTKGWGPLGKWGRHRRTRCGKRNHESKKSQIMTIRKKRWYWQVRWFFYSTKIPILHVNWRAFCQRISHNNPHTLRFKKKSNSHILICLLSLCMVFSVDWTSGHLILVHCLTSILFLYLLYIMLLRLYEQLNRGTTLLKYCSRSLNVARWKNSKRGTVLSNGF